MKQLFAVLAILLFFNITLTGQIKPSIEKLKPSSLFKTSFKAKTNAKYGQYGALPCIDVEEAFGAASGSYKKRHRFSFNPKDRSENGSKPDAYHVKDHLQSVVRLSGVGNENYIAFSRSARDIGDAAIYLANFYSINSNGDAWKWANSRFSDNTNSYYYYRIKDSNHAGGMQALGGMLFIAMDCDEGACDPFIQIMDVRNPAKAKSINRINLSKEYTGQASAVAAVQLSDGKYLVCVNGSSSQKKGWFFLSDSSTITANTKWAKIDTWYTSDLEKGTEWYSWENLSFITDCSGDIYLVALGTSNNKCYLYKLNYKHNSTQNIRKTNFYFDKISSRGLNTSGTDSELVMNIIGQIPGVNKEDAKSGPSLVQNSPNTRWGANVHITPSRDIVSYVVSRNIDNTPGRGCRINEFRYHRKKGYSGIRYLGNYPDDKEATWTDDIQGVANDKDYWYFTQAKRLWKIPISMNLQNTKELKPTTQNGVKRLKIPEQLLNKGYYDFKDMDIHKGYIFISVKGDNKAAIAVYSTSSLSYLGYFPLPEYNNNSTWCAINSKGELFSSNNKIKNGDLPIYVYSINWKILQSQNKLNLTFNRRYELKNIPEKYNNGSITTHVAGGDFSDDDSFLFISNGKDGGDRSLRGLWAFQNIDDNYGEYVIKSSQEGEFRFQFGSDDVAKGISYFDYRGDKRIPKDSGCLHAILRDNDKGKDNIYFKHYSIDFRELKNLSSK